MLTVEAILNRVRAAIHDEQKTGYSDATLTSYINDGIRFLRRTVFEINPLLLTDIDLSGTLAAGKGALAVGARLTHVSALRVGGRLLRQIDPNELADLTVQGVPQAYYLQGLDTVRIYPVPKEAMPFHLLGTKDMQLLKKGSDVSPFPNDMDDWLLEYVNIRASMSNEFDIGQETQVMQNIITQVESMLHGLSPHGIQTEGYWNGAMPL